MIYIGNTQVSKIFLATTEDPICYLGNYKTYPRGVVTTAVTQVVLVYSNSSTNMIEADGSGYARLKATVVTYLDNEPYDTDYVYLNARVFLDQNWYIDQEDSTKIRANNRGRTEGPVRSAQVKGSIEGYSMEVWYEAYQAENYKHYSGGTIEKVWLDAESASTATGYNFTIGSESGTFTLGVDGWEAYWYDALPVASAATVLHGGTYIVDTYVDSHGWAWLITSGGEYASISNGNLVVDMNQSTLSNRTIGLRVMDPNHSDSVRADITITQEANAYVLKLVDGTPTPVVVGWNVTAFTVDVISRNGLQAQPLASVGFTYNDIGLSETHSYISADNVYRIYFTGTTNSTSSDKTTTVNIVQTQSGKRLDFQVSQPSSSHYINGIEVISSYTCNSIVWVVGMVLNADGETRTLLVARQDGAVINPPVKVNVTGLTYQDPGGSTHTESNRSFNVETGSTVTLNTFYYGEMTYNAAVFMNDSGYYSIQNVTALNVGFEDITTVRDVTVQYYENMQSPSLSSNSYIPASGDGYAIIKGTLGANDVLLTPSFYGQYDSNVWSIDSQYSRICAENRSTVSGASRTVQVSGEYGGATYGPFTITQQENLRSNNVSPGEIEWVRVNGDQIVDGDVVGVDNFENVLRITGVNGYRKRSYTSGSFEKESLGNNDYDVTVDYYARQWMNTGQSKDEIEITANTATSGYRQGTVTIEDSNHYSNNPALTFTVNQSADTWQFSLYDSSSKQIDYDETAFTIDVYSKYNGAPYAPDGQITFGGNNAIGVTAGTATLVDQNNGRYRISFTCGQNNGNSNLTTNIEISQNAHTGTKKVTVGLTQLFQIQSGTANLEVGYNFFTSAPSYDVYISYYVDGVREDRSFNVSSQGGTYTITGITVNGSSATVLLIPASCYVVARTSGSPRLTTDVQPKSNINISNGQTGSMTIYETYS